MDTTTTRHDAATAPVASGTQHNPPIIIVSSIASTDGPPAWLDTIAGVVDDLPGSVYDRIEALARLDAWVQLELSALRASADRAERRAVERAR
jgi:hypothetical protein